MKRGQRASNSPEPGEDQQLWSKDLNNHLSSCECTSGYDSMKVSDVEADCAVKTSQRFLISPSFGEGQRLPSKSERGEDDQSENSTEASDGEALGLDKQVDCLQTEEKGTVSEKQQEGLFRPQELWLTMTRCLNFRWLSISKQSNRKLAHQTDCDQSEDSQSPASTGSTNGRSSSTSISDDRDASTFKRKEKDFNSRGVKSSPLSRPGISHSSPGIPRTRQPDSMLASVILDKEMFLSVELVDSGEEGGDLRYKAEWKLSERTKELAEGVWLSQSHKEMD